MKILISPNVSKELIFDNMPLICQELKALNAEIYMSAKFKDFFSDINIIFDSDIDYLYNICDVVIALGGDATIIRTAKKAALFKKPVLGINVGRLGFMAGLEINEIHMLSCLFDKNYEIEERMMLSVKINNKDKTYYALNDAVVSKGSLSRIIDINVKCGGNAIYDYRADGIMVATPTGSTAYNLSAGGPVIDPKLKCMIMTPICPHSLLSRSILFHPKDQLILSAKKPLNTDIFLTIDGEMGIKLNEDDQIYINESDINASFIRIKNKAFYDVLNEKLMNRGLYYENSQTK